MIAKKKRRADAPSFWVESIPATNPEDNRKALDGLALLYWQEIEDRQAKAAAQVPA